MITTGFDRALASLAGSGRFESFAVLEESGGKRQMRRYYAGETIAIDLGDEVAVGREALLTPETARCVFLYDGSLVVEGQLWNAIFADCFERGSTHGLVLAQRYVPGAAGAAPAAVGGARFVSETEPLLR
jgi:hypothetical protein